MNEQIKKKYNIQGKKDIYILCRKLLVLYNKNTIIYIKSDSKDNCNKRLPFKYTQLKRSDHQRKLLIVMMLKIQLEKLNAALVSIKVFPQKHWKSFWHIYECTLIAM